MASMVMETKVTLEIKCENSTEINLLSNILSPENKLLDDRTTITFIHNKDSLSLEIKSVANTNSVRYILDDILFTIELINKVRLVLE
ncbi:MAG: hypothetical protein ACTSUF_01125 [Candidatus Heimdallarchaeaceae archaeon]